MNFSEKQIDVTITLAQGNFANGTNTVTLSGHRVTANIVNHGGDDQSFADLSIYGMSEEVMNQLSNVGSQYKKSYLNDISVMAGDSVSGMSLVFTGQIWNAFIDAQSLPEVFFQVSARPGYYYQMKPTTPTSIQGSGDVALMMKNLASEMGFSFENAGVKARLANPYYWGTAWQQVAQIARDAGVEWFLDRGTLVIMNASTPREGDTPIISANTGMLGYPVFNQNMVIVRSLFNPGIKYGGNVQIQSELTAANGNWIVQDLQYELDSLLPGGRWNMVITGRIAGETTP